MERIKGNPVHFSVWSGYGRKGADVYEQQSTYNLNMSVRQMMYAAKLL